MRRFAAFVKKEFFHIFRDKRTLVILFGMPVVQILLFGYAITNEIREAKIAILDKSKDHLTIRLTNKILSSGYFQLAEYLESEHEIEQSFRRGQIKQVVIFSEKFAEKLERERRAEVKLLGDATDPNTSNTLINYTSSIILDFQREVNAPISISRSVIPEARMRYNPNLKSVFLFVPGLII